jgi:hypothetical protein
MAVTIAPESVTYIARRASPTARSTPDIAMPSAIGTLAGMVMARKFEATGKASPCACRTLTRPQSRNANITADTAAEMNAVIVSADAASLRPRGRSPAPSARDTVADTAMVRPMLIDMTKKVARPT